MRILVSANVLEWFFSLLGCAMVTIGMFLIF